MKITLKYVHEVPTSRRWFMTSLVMAFAIFLLKGKVWKVPVCGMHGTIPGTVKERPRTQQCPGEAALETRLCSACPKSFPALGWNALGPVLVFLEKGMATHSRVLAGEPHGQRSLAGYSPRGRRRSDTTERLTFFRGILFPAIAPTCQASEGPRRC